VQLFIRPRGGKPEMNHCDLIINTTKRKRARNIIYRPASDDGRSSRILYIHLYYYYTHTTPHTQDHRGGRIDGCVILL